VDCGRAIGRDGAIERAVGLKRRQHCLEPLQERRRMRQMAIHAGQDQRLRPIAEVIEPQDPLPGVGRHIRLGGKLR